ncbi:MAG: DMT family transporter [Bacteroidota bacterium]
MKAYYLLIIWALLAGAALPLQGSLNAKLGEAVKDPVYGAFITFIIGGIGLLIYLLVTKVDFSTVGQVNNVHWSVWLGGLLGAFYVVAMIILVPKIGATLFFGLTIFGQMTLALLLDHYGFMGFPVQAINWQRIAGVVLIVGGVLLIRSF